MSQEESSSSKRTLQTGVHLWLGTCAADAPASKSTATSECEAERSVLVSPGTARFCRKGSGAWWGRRSSHAAQGPWSHVAPARPASAAVLPLYAGHQLLLRVVIGDGRLPLGPLVAAAWGSAGRRPDTDKMLPSKCVSTSDHSGLQGYTLKPKLKTSAQGHPLDFLPQHPDGVSLACLSVFISPSTSTETSG